MQIVADILVGAGAFGAAFYCYILATRLKRFSTLEGGMGGAIAVLSAQVDDMTRALEVARTTAGGSATHLETLTERAEGVAARLELLVASMHDLPQPSEPVAEPSAGRLRFVRRSGRARVEAAE